MKREDLLKEMRESVGTKDPIEFFTKLPDVLGLLFDRIDQLEGALKRVQKQSALAINWDPRVASLMLVEQVNILRQDKDTYANEITALKLAFAEGKVTQSYEEFTKFWQETLGFHPFVD